MKPETPGLIRADISLILSGCNWPSGKPDLLLWRLATRSAQLVEVRLFLSAFCEETSRKRLFMQLDKYWLSGRVCSYCLILCLILWHG